MHRRGVNAVGELAVLRSTSRCFARPRDAVAARDYSQNAAQRKPSPRLDHDKFEAVDLWTKRMVGNSNNAGKATWKQTPGYDAEVKHLKASVSSKKRPIMASSTEKAQFLSATDETDFDDMEFEEAEFKGKIIPPGTFVEIRRNEVVSHGIVLHNDHIAGRPVVVTLSETGEVWPHTELDVMFAIANFAEKELIERCGKEIEAQDEHQIAARVCALKRLRKLEASLDRRSNLLSHSLVPVYEKCCHEDRNTWAQVTENKVVKLIDPYSNPIPTLTKLVVHKHLFQHHKQFVAEMRGFLNKKSFWVRPRQHLTDIIRVDEMVVHRDPRVGAFIEKARQKILSSRSVVQESWDEPPSERLDTSMEFTQEDRIFIRYFQQAHRSRRSIQQNPFNLSQSDILKRIGLYTGEVDDNVCSQFLSEIGILPPWEDVITRGNYNDAFESPYVRMPHDVKPGDASQTTQPLVIRPKPAQPLGPEDFYPDDVVESIRHDFGDMPVYVIDDAGAEELDDGISIERVPSRPGHAWIHVHVADPTSLIPPTHTWSQKALRKSGTAYWIDRTIPMLPHSPLVSQLSLHVGSKDGKPQRTMTFSFTVDDSGNIVDYVVRPGLVKNVITLNYDDVDVAMGNPTNLFRHPFGLLGSLLPQRDTSPFTDSVVKDLTTVRDITSRLLAERIRNGATAYARDFCDLSLPTRPLPTRSSDFTHPSFFRGFPKVIYTVSSSRSPDTGARGIVAECMKAASRVASRFFRDREIPAVRRVAASFDSQDDGVERLLAARDELGFVDAIETLRLGLFHPTGGYELEPRAHAILGIPDGEGYSRVTSPLRRFSDMVAHWQIKHALLEPSSPPDRLFSKQWLEEFMRWTAYVEDRMKRANLVQTYFWATLFLGRWKASAHMRSSDTPDPLQSLVGRVCGALLNNRISRSHQIAVDLPSLGLRAQLRGLTAEDDYELGEEIPVELEAVRAGLKPLLFVKKKY